MIFIIEEISGYQNEYAFSRYLNGKKIRMLNPVFKEMFDRLYGQLDEESRIKAKVDMRGKKYDLLIDVNNNVKRISIKKGIMNSVHAEGITSFIHFLIGCGVDRDIVIKYLKYHYADGTTDGSGKKRMSSKEYKELFQNDIDEINRAINTPCILKQAINRFVLQGKNSNEKIDGIIHGVIDDFFWITSEDAIDIIMSQIDIYSTGVHFGQLYCQPHNRCLNYNKKLEHKRFCIQIKWYSMTDDILKFMNQNCDSDVS